MIRYIKKRLSVKIFLLTFVLLAGIAGGTYGFVASVMPVMYANALSDTLEARAETMAKALEDYPREKAYSLLTEFANGYRSSVVLTDENGEKIYGTLMSGDEWLEQDVEASAVEAAGEVDSVYDEMDVSAEDASGTWEDSSEYFSEDFSMEGASEAAEIDDSENIDSEYTSESAAETAAGTTTEVSGELSGNMLLQNLENRAMASYQVRFQDSDEPYTLYVFGPTEQVTQAVETLREILPALLAAIVLVSLVIAFFYSRYLARPVAELSRISRHMAELDFSARSQSARADEVGVLSRSLNTLAENLDQALRELRDANAKLKSDVEKEREQERRQMEFFAAASHELKTPVTILKGQLDGMIQQVGDYRDRDRYLRRALGVTENLESMVAEILTVSRIETKKLPVQYADTDLAELVRLQLADLNELFEQKAFRLEIFLPEKFPWVTDPALFTLIIRNLLTNAQRYSPEGERITVHLWMEQSGSAAFSVENTGVHIDAEDLEKIFDAFYRTDTSRNRKSGGTGLGLYIVRGALEQLGGVYQMENTAAGVKFTFRLPQIPPSHSPETKTP